MSEITIEGLTNKSESEEGTGVFDVLMGSINLQLTDQYDTGRITGAEYATVYLGAIQSTLQQSVNFLMSQQEASKKVELLTAQIEEAAERVDLVIAQTAAAYESVKSSQSKTLRENVLNNGMVEKVAGETALIASKDLEEVANTLRKDIQSEATVTDLNYGIGVKEQQILNLRDKNGDFVTRYTYYENGESGTTTTTTDLSAVVGPVVATTIEAGESASVVALEKAMLAAKDRLVTAQTLGFASDTKHKILKQMNDGFAVGLSVAGRGNIPEANQDAAIDQLTQEMLDDLNSTVIVQSVIQVPDTGDIAPELPTVDGQ